MPPRHLPHTDTIALPVTGKGPFNFRHTLWKPSHFGTGLEAHTAAHSWRTFRLDDLVVGVRMRAEDNQLVTADVFTDGTYEPEYRERLTRRLTASYGLDEDVDEFTELASKVPAMQGPLEALAGMRQSCPEDHFEIAVISLLLQNVTISRTTQMTRNLLIHHGKLVHFAGITLLGAGRRPRRHPTAHEGAVPRPRWDSRPLPRRARIPPLPRRPAARRRRARRVEPDPGDLSRLNPFRPKASARLRRCPPSHAHSHLVRKQTSTPRTAPKEWPELFERPQAPADQVPHTLHPRLEHEFNTCPRNTRYGARTGPFLEHLYSSLPPGGTVNLAAVPVSGPVTFEYRPLHLCPPQGSSVHGVDARKPGASRSSRPDRRWGA